MNGTITSALDRVRRCSSFAAAVSLLYSGDLEKSGWFRSVRERAAVDAEGAPIPWISYPALRFLEQRITSDMDVFEFGSGNSTLWWAERVRRVVACEANETWYKRIAGLAPDNAEIVRVDESDYAGVLERQTARPDIVVIDGGDRVAVARSAINWIGEGGVIVWDDSDRTDYREGISCLRDGGFRQLEFSGLGPIVNLTKVTSVFYRPDNVLGI